MTTSTDKTSENDDIEMLLPWYVTGKLDAADRERVDAYLMRHPELRARLELSHAERTETAFLNEPVAAPSASTVDAFMAQIGERKQVEDRLERTQPITSTGPFAWIRDNLIGPLVNPVQMHWGAVTAALVIAVQAVAIVLLLSTPQQQGAVYQTASGNQQAIAPGTHVDVRFANDARAADIAAIMAELNMTIAGGPKAGGFFVVRIGPETMSEAEVANRIAALRQQTGIVMFVTAAK